MASISQGLVFTTAMVLSSTVLYLAFSKQKNYPPFQSNKQILRSCLYSDEKKRVKSKKKKTVKFAENVIVKEVATDSKVEIIEEQGNKNRGIVNNCRNEMPKNHGVMPANRVALYNGILRDRSYRMGCCH